MQDETIQVDGEKLTLSGVENPVTLTAEGSSVTLVDGLKNATVHVVDRDVTVNGAAIQIDEPETAFDVIISGSKISEVTGLDAGASLSVSREGTYIVNGTAFDVKADYTFVATNESVYIYDSNNKNVTTDTAIEDILTRFNVTAEPETVKTGETDLSTGTVAAAVLLTNGNQSVTLNNLGHNAAIVSETANGFKDIGLGDGGDLVVVEDTGAPVTITAGAGNDTIISQGENVHVSLTGGNTRIFPLEGRMTLEGYDASTGAGFGTTYENIFTAVEDGSIDFNNGNLSLHSAQVDVGKRSALMNFFNRDGKLQRVGYASQGDSLDVSNSTKNFILVAKENASITSGSGNDTIFANEGSFVDSGEGKNLVKSNGATVALNGRTTVEGEVDTIYIAGAAPAVDFKASGLTFYGGNDRLTMRDVTTTAKVNLYYEEPDRMSRGVFIAKDDWYKVSDSDLAVGAGEDVYFVGSSATRNHGSDFSEITKDLNITLNTEYYIPDNKMWVNNVHSIKGGAGNTTIIGSDKNDTILAGSGEQSIYGGAGHDKMYGNTDADKNVATFYYTAGDGRDSIANFDFTNNAQDVTADKVQLDDGSTITEVLLRGDDVMLKVDGADGFLMLEGAQGKSFRVNDDLIAKVDTNVEFDGFTNCYVGIGAEATLTVGKGLGNVEVWLSDDSLEYHGKMYDAS